MSSGRERNPQAKARILGATPKVMTSASESSSRPKSLSVLVRRAMRPSSASKGIAKPMASAARSKWWGCCGRSVQALGNREEAGGNVDRGEHRGQDEHATGTARLWPRRHSGAGVAASPLLTPATPRQQRRAWLQEPRGDAGDHAGSAADAVANFHERLGVSGQEDVGAGAKFNEADALATSRTGPRGAC